MIPLFENLIPVIKLLEGSGAVIYDKLHTPCPYCEAPLHVRPISSPTFSYCSACRTTLDPVSLFDQAQEINDLPTTIVDILQQTHSDIKSNNTDKHIKYVCEPNLQANLMVANSDELFSSTRWIKTHGQLLRDLNLYPGMNKDLIEDLKSVVVLWDKYKQTKQVLMLTALEEAHRAKRTIFIPSYNVNGNAGGWDICSTTKTTYLHRKGAKGSGGISFYNQTITMDCVIAIKDPILAMQLHFESLKRFKRPAPVVLYNDATTQEDWSLLDSKEVVFPRTKTGKQVVTSTLRHMMWCKNPYVSLDSPANSMQNIQKHVKSRVPMYSWVVESKDFLRTNRFLLEKLDVTVLLKRVHEELGEEVAASLVLGTLLVENRSIIYSGAKIEERKDGYYTLGSDRQVNMEKLTNFTVSLNKILRYRFSNRLDYEITVHMNGDSVDMVVDSNFFDAYKLDDRLKRTFLDAGMKGLPYAKKTWMQRLKDLIQLFSDPEIFMVPERVDMDEETGIFYLPNMSITSDGLVERYDPIDRGLPLLSSGEPDSKSLNKLENVFGKAAFELSCYVAYYIVSRMYNKHPSDITPIVFPSKSVKLSNMPQLILRKGVEGLTCKSFPKATDFIYKYIDEGSLIMELPRIEAYAVGLVCNALVVDSEISQLMSMQDRKDAIQAFDDLTVGFLRYMLIGTDGYVEYKICKGLFMGYVSTFGEYELPCTMRDCAKKWIVARDRNGISRNIKNVNVAMAEALHKMTLEDQGIEVIDGSIVMEATTRKAREK